MTTTRDAERVIELDVGVRWDPNTPEATLSIIDAGQAVLGVRHHPDDQDARTVILRWEGIHFAAMGDPNDEAISGHRLASAGLTKVLWAGEVWSSLLIAELERRNEVHPHHDSSRYANLRHFVVPLKESVVEVVAQHLTVHRIAGSTRQALSVLA